MKRKNIQYIIDGIVEYANSNNIYEVYQALGIQIQFVNEDSTILNKNDAVYIRDFFDYEVVFIKDNLEERYQQFVLAHELAHAIMHYNLFHAAFNRNLMVKSKFETEANLFAIMFLDIKFDSIEDRDLTSKQLSMKYAIPEDVIIKYFST